MTKEKKNKRTTITVQQETYELISDAKKPFDIKTGKDLSFNTFFKSIFSAKRTEAKNQLWIFCPNCEEEIIVEKVTGDKRCPLCGQMIINYSNPFSAPLCEQPGKVEHPAQYEVATTMGSVFVCSTDKGCWNFVRKKFPAFVKDIIELKRD